jgi:putative transposase
VSRHVPFHVTLRMAAGLPSLRDARPFAVLVEAVRQAHREDGRICHFTAERDHVHLIGEADDTRALARLMQRLKIRLALGLNRLWGRRGSVFGERYHVEHLSSPRQVRFTLGYVLNNHRRHVWKRYERTIVWDWLDPFSTAAFFSGFDHEPESFSFGAAGDPPVTAPRSWLLRTGWKRHGPVRIDEVPGVPAQRRGRRTS